MNLNIRNPFIIFFIPLILSILLLNCGSNAIGQGVDAKDAKLEWVVASEVSTSGARITWKCSAPTMGYLKVTSSNGYDYTGTTFFPLDVHSIPLGNLASDTNYSYTPTCGLTEKGLGFPMNFKTVADNNVIFKRSIWMIGGIGSDKNPIADIDYYDPDTNQWGSSITKVPTPRINAQIVSHKNKIYIIGGLTKSGVSYSPSRLVEVYDPFQNKWTTLSSITSTLQGGVAGSVGNDIYILGGSTSADMTTGTILNTIYKLQPDLGTSGTWSDYLSTNIYARIDMAGCTYQGSIFYTGGRFYNDGLAYATSDAYSPSLNSVTAKIEASVSIARHGSAYACYRPNPDDPNPSDPSLFLVAGGSTATDIVQPVSAITPSNRFEYMVLGTAANAFVTGSNLPANLYAPSMEISYTQRKAFLFGGASEINLPTDSIYSLDLSSPGLQPWESVSVKMPRSRFGHKAVILSR
ncbi:kelch repeat-containing protein [Leptospira sp. 'Mane']|uniref:kelch repeat-containing protein n=1 Tax=Leptospira sp. 'Mane' TaxID=3387407 RepID=UPI00398B9036